MKEKLNLLRLWNSSVFTYCQIPLSMANTNWQPECLVRTRIYSVSQIQVLERDPLLQTQGLTKSWYSDRSPAGQVLCNGVYHFIPAMDPPEKYPLIFPSACLEQDFSHKGEAINGRGGSLAKCWKQSQNLDQEQNFSYKSIPCQKEKKNKSYSNEISNALTHFLK